MKETVEVLRTRLKRELMCMDKTSGCSESVFIIMSKSLTPPKYFIYIYIYIEDITFLTAGLVAPGQQIDFWATRVDWYLGVFFKLSSF